jgi:hypothetical protein
MSNEKKTKWEIGATITAGNNAYSLAKSYSTDIETRLQPDEMAQLKSNTIELEVRRSGQAEILTLQKSKTLSQDEIASKLHDAIVGLRNIVKYNNTVTPDILKAFGVGEKLVKPINSVMAGANTLISAYNEYPEWSKSAGIIESDITEISDLLIRLTKAEEVQNNAMFTRKSKTMDKNVLQRAVEDEVSKISVLGQYIFRIKDAAVAKLFEDLIPASSRVKSDTVTVKSDTITDEKVNG